MRMSDAALFAQLDSGAQFLVERSIDEGEVVYEWLIYFVHLVTDAILFL